MSRCQQDSGRAAAGGQLGDCLNQATTGRGDLGGRTFQRRPAMPWPRCFLRPITDEGVAVGGAFDSDTATGMMPAAQRVAGVLTSWRS